MSSASREPIRMILVHWNRPEVCLATLHRFRAQTADVALAVVDNGSTAKNLAILKAGLAPDVVLLEQPTNTGFGPGANTGLRYWLEHDSWEWAGVAPHDADAANDALEVIVDGLATQPDVGLVSADVGDGFTPVVQPFLGAIDAPQTKSEGFESGDYAHGTLHLFRRPCVEEIGLFDERYFAYCEEADLGLRAKARGWRVGVMRGAEVRNPMVKTPHPVVDYLQERNTLLLLADHYGPRQVLFRTGVSLWQLISGPFNPKGRNHFWTAKSRILALRDAALRRWGRPPPSILPNDPGPG
ncbi:MAG: glycosyltransferase [Acidimicrobiales bacterium]|nr:glycosyltransferase [Acidimicrobiales bacterium]